MLDPLLQNGLADALKALEFPVYDFDPDTCTLTDTGRVVNPLGVLICPEELRFEPGSNKIRGRTMVSQRWEVTLSFNETVYCHEVFSRLAADPPQFKAIVPPPGQREEPGLTFRWTFHLQRVRLHPIPSAGSQKGSSYELTFDVTHA